MISIRTIGGVLLGFVCVAQTHPNLAAADPQPKLTAQPKQDEGVIEPKADAALRRMSDYLANLKQFRVESTSIDEKVTTERQKIQEVKESKLAVKRPGSLRIDRNGPNGHAVFRDDGKQFTLYNSDKNVFADGNAPATLDAAVDQARDRLSIDAPGGDFIVSDSYKALTDGMEVGRYVGLEPIGEVKAHHIAVTKKDVDFEVWIQDGPTPVPLRYVIVTKDMATRPEHTLEMRNWDTNASISDDDFKLAMPKDAKRIDLTAAKQEKQEKEQKK
jgi:hypothetical protein